METVKSTAPYIELPAFQGPLDLLLHLIKVEKVDIYDIPIAKIADQFIGALKQMESLDMEVTSEFLVLAAQLLHIKSRMLLPKPPKETEETIEEDPRKDLVERLIAYKAFKEAAEALSRLQNGSGRRYFREVCVEEIVARLAPDDPLQGICFEDLLNAFREVVERANAEEQIDYIEPEKIQLELVMENILRRILLTNSKGIAFKDIIRGHRRIEIVVSFLAVLELLKLGKITARQTHPWGEIILLPTSKATDFA